MYFEAISLKDKKPNSGIFRTRVVLLNSKTKEVMTFQIGMATDWEYFMKGKGYTHWIKPISKKELKEKIE